MRTENENSYKATSDNRFSILELQVNEALHKLY